MCWWEWGWKEVLCAAGKRISVHWLRVGALSRSAGVAPVAATVATSVIKAHVWSSYFIRKKEEADGGSVAEGKAARASTPKQFTLASALVLNWALSGKPPGEIHF